MLKIFALRDVKSDSYGGLLCLPTAGIAMRGLMEILANPESPLSKYPDDYSLYELGEFDPSSGMVTALKVPVFVTSVLSLVKPAPAPAPVPVEVQ